MNANKIERVYTHYEKNAAGTYAPAGTTVYAVQLDGSELIFEKAGRVRRVPVEKDNEGFVYSFRKRKIKAEGGAPQLFEAMRRWSNENDGKGGCFFFVVIDKVFDFMTVKEA